MIDRAISHSHQRISICCTTVVRPIRLFTFFALIATLLLATRPALAMQGFQDNMLLQYKSPQSKLANMCANCHADWGGRETRHNLGVAYYLYENITNSTTSVFALLDPDKDGVSTTTELTNSQSASYPGDSTRWIPGLPDKDGDGCVQLYYRSDENGMPLVAATIVADGYIGSPSLKAPLTYGPKGWDIDDNDATQGCNTMGTWPTNGTPGATFTSPGTTTDSTPPGQITDLRASGLTPTQLPLTWTAVADDGTSGIAAYEYDLRYTTEALALAHSTCGGATCKVRKASDWSLMWDMADSDADDTLGTYLGKTGGTLASSLGVWNTGAADTPLMRALYEPLPGSPGASETYTIQTTGTTVTTNSITDSVTYWLAIRTGDGVVIPTHVETPTGFTENISSVSNIIAITAGSSGAAITSYSNSNGLPINNSLSNTITANGYGLDTTNAAKLVLVDTSGAVIATAGEISHSGSTAVTGIFYCPIAAGTYTLEARTSSDVTKAAWVDAVTVTSNTSCRSAYATSGTAGNAKVTLGWTTSAAADYNSTVILRWTGTTPGAEVPATSTSYTVGNTIGTATVACVDTTGTSSQVFSGKIDGTGGAAPCGSTALTSGTYYSYKIFQKFDDGTYDAGVVFVGSPFLPLGATITTAAGCVTGNWNAGATWTGGVVPNSTNPVVITGICIVTVTADAASATLTFDANTSNDELIINSGVTFTTGDILMEYPIANNRTSTLTVGAGTLIASSISMFGDGITNIGELTIVSISTGTATISGNITSGGPDSRLIFTGAGTLNVGGSFMSGIQGTFTTFAGSTVNFTGSNPQIISPFAYTYTNVGISGTGTKTLGAATTMNGNLTISSGSTLDVGAFNLTVSGTTGVTGTLIHSSTTGTKLHTGLVTINSGGVWNNSANEAIEFRGGLTNNGTFTAGSGTYTFSTNAQAIGGTVATSIPNISTSVVLTNNIATGGLTVSTSLAGAGTFAQGTNAILTYGAATAPTVTTFTANTSGNTVDYSGASPAMRVVSYHHLTFSGSGTASGAITTVGGNLSIVGAGGSAYTTAANLTVTGNVDIRSSTTLTVGAFNITVSGVTAISSGTLTHASATGTKQYTGLVTVGSGAVWDNSANAAINFRGGLTNDGTFTAGTGLYTFDTNAQAIGGTAATAIPNMTTAIVLTNNISTGTGLTVSTALAGAGTFTQGTNAVLTYTASAVPAVTTLTASASGNTVDYGGAAQTIKLPSGAPATYYNLTLSSSGAKTLPGTAMTISGNLSLSGTATATAAAALTVTGNVSIGAGTTFDAATFTHNVAGNWTNAGTFTASTSTITLNGTNQTLTGNSTFNNLTKSVTAAATLTFAASSTQTISGLATLTGAASNLLSLRSSSAGTYWLFHANGTKSFDYLDVKDSDASGSSIGQPFSPTNSVDSGHNIGWFASVTLTVSKASTLISDPFNGVTNPKHIPGAVVEYTITVANTGATSPDVNTVYITDPLDSGNLSYYVTGGITFTQGATTSALALGTVTYSSTASPGPYVYNYTPVADGNGYDAAVTSIKILTTGTFAFGGAPAPSFTLKFRVQVK